MGENFGRRKNDRFGRYTVIEGLDGIGKGFLERCLREDEERKQKAVFDAIAWSRANERLPGLADFHGVPRPHFNTIIVSEPTYVGIGHSIRNEMISKKAKEEGRVYDAEMKIQAYSLDRLLLMQNVIIPALQNGVDVLESRCMASTLTYQVLEAIEKGDDANAVWEDVLAHPGNKLQLKYSPDLLVIATIDDAQKVIQRIGERREIEKDDDSTFENPDFQSKLKPLYESEKLKKLFENNGTIVAYLNAGLDRGQSRKQILDIYRNFYSSGKLPERYTSLKKLFSSPNL